MRQSFLIVQNKGWFNHLSAAFTKKLYKAKKKYANRVQSNSTKKFTTQTSFVCVSVCWKNVEKEKRHPCSRGIAKEQH